ncbi:hypothetical protein AMTRI_Chr10g230630 [Amborella trichopoda]
MCFHALLRPRNIDSLLFLGTHTRFVTTKRMMVTPPICNLLSSCLAGKDLPLRSPPLSPRPTETKCRSGANRHRGRKDSPSGDH